MKEMQPNIMEAVAKVFISLALLGTFGLFFILYNALVVKSEKLRSILRNKNGRIKFSSFFFFFIWIHFLCITF